jgi:hypothetical protein
MLPCSSESLVSTWSPHRGTTQMANIDKSGANLIVEKDGNVQISALTDTRESNIYIYI